MHDELYPHSSWCARRRTMTSSWFAYQCFHPPHDIERLEWMRRLVARYKPERLDREPPFYDASWLAWKIATGRDDSAAWEEARSVRRRPLAKCTCKPQAVRLRLDRGVIELSVPPDKLHQVLELLGLAGVGGTHAG